MSTLHTKMEEILTEFGKVLSNIPDKLFERMGLCALKFNGSCFWGAIETTRYFDLDSAKRYCESHRSKLAGVYSVKHYEQVVACLRELIPPMSQFSDVWLGMTKDATTGTVLLPTGRKAPNLKWIVNRPGESDWNFIILRVYADVHSASGGILDYIPSYLRNGVLCEI